MISEIRSIPLTQGLFAIVDECDYERVSQHKWHARNCDKRWYACRKVNNKAIYMHVGIAGKKAGFMTDHINGNGLDNRRCNLRFATCQQNSANREPSRNCVSKYKGVTYYKNTTSKHWAARIGVNGETIWLGVFETEIEAAQAYDLAAIEHFGTFARINEYAKEELEDGRL